MRDAATKKHFKVVEKGNVERPKETVKAAVAPTDPVKENLLLNKDGTPKTARQLIAEAEQSEDKEFLTQLSESKFKTVADKAKEKLNALV